MGKNLNKFPCDSKANVITWNIESNTMYLPASKTVFESENWKYCQRKFVEDYEMSLVDLGTIGQQCPEKTLGTEMIVGNNHSTWNHKAVTILVTNIKGKTQKALNK